MLYYTGQIVYLDESPPLLKGILLNGGHLVFDDNQDIKLMMEYMIIIGDGSLVVIKLACHNLLLV